MERSVYVCIVVLASCALDAIRDANITRDPQKVSWIMWHVVKWGSIFPVWIALTALYVPWEWWCPLAVACKFAWRLAYRIKLDGIWMNCQIFKGK